MCPNWKQTVSLTSPSWGETHPPRPPLMIPCRRRAGLGKVFKSTFAFFFCCVFSSLYQNSKHRKTFQRTNYKPRAERETSGRRVLFKFLMSLSKLNNWFLIPASCCCPDQERGVLSGAGIWGVFWRCVCVCVCVCVGGGYSRHPLLSSVQCLLSSLGDGIDRSIGWFGRLS